MNVNLVVLMPERIRVLFAALLAVAAVGCVNAHRRPLCALDLDDIKSIEDPVCGLGGTVSPQAEFVEGKIGKALYVPAHGAMAKIPFPNGFPSKWGKIEFWAKVGTRGDRFYDGVDPYLFIVTADAAKGWPVVFEFNYNANNGCGKSGIFCGMSYGRALNVPVKDCCFSSILGKDDPFGWHKYTICWDRNRLDDKGNFMSLSIDDMPVGAGMSSDKEVDDFCRGISQPVHLVLSNPEDDGHGKSAVVVDDFRIWGE